MHSVIHLDMTSKYARWSRVPLANPIGATDTSALLPTATDSRKPGFIAPRIPMSKFFEIGTGAPWSRPCDAPSVV